MARANNNQSQQEDPAVDIVDVAAENVELKKQVAELQKQIKEILAEKSPVNIKGFLLDAGNPFGDGVIRAYRRAGGKSAQPDRLPFVLPDKEDASNEALKNYIVRADAANDNIRAGEARKALK